VLPEKLKMMTNGGAKDLNSFKVEIKDGAVLVEA
jgi:hypothetical protein